MLPPDQFRLRLLQRATTLRHNKYHTRPQYKDMLDKPTLNYDGMADFWVRRYEDFENAYKDPYYLETVKKDEEYLFDVKTLKVTAGAEFHVIDNGRVL